MEEDGSYTPLQVLKNTNTVYADCTVCSCDFTFLSMVYNNQKLHKRQSVTVFIAVMVYNLSAEKSPQKYMTVKLENLGMSFHEF